ncbi:MAG: toprim domain-containing protein [Pseudomonadota bacterium]
MATIAELKIRIDLHDLAERLGLERPKSGGNYKSPHHKDKNPSLAIPASKNSPDTWRDYSGDKGGDIVDLVEYVRGLDTSEAVKWLHEQYGIPFDKPDQGEKRQLSTVEWIALKCRDDQDSPGWKEKAITWLVEQRGISKEVAERAVQKGAVGWNAWTSTKVEQGQPGYGGEGVAFIVRNLVDGRTVAVDMRYQDPELNGGVKTQTQGEKFGFPWFADAQRLKKAHTIYWVESSINALSVESCGLKGVAAVSIRGTGNAGNIDLTLGQGKKNIICMDNDEPDEHGKRPGAEAAWTLYERLTALDIAAHLVDQADWEHNDVNDILKAEGADALKHLIRDKFEPWIIPGLCGDADKRKGRPRLFLPPHDFGKYWLYRAKEDFTTYVNKVEKDDDGGPDKLNFGDLCGFRVAGLSRVTIASAVSVMSGEQDSQPRTLFACSVQVPRHGSKLERKVFADEQLHNVDQWKKFGPVFAPAAFSRMLTILERAAHLGARDAVNFVGLAWRDGKLQVNEGKDCFFVDPEKQCQYHNLRFPSGSPADGKRVLDAYQGTFKHNAAALLLVWSLGGHLKPLLGYWPHLTLQARKGAGKSTLIKRLERTIAFQMFSGQSLQTEFRLLTTISHTSHPVGWEEISARRQDVIDKAVAMLQENYQYTVTRRGSDMTEYLLSAPVLLAGEDVPVDSLIGKLVRVSLKDPGPLMPEGLPRFPVRQWLEFLSTLTRDRLMEMHAASREQCSKMCRATGQDSGARRMVENYSALVTAWRLLCEFLEIPNNYGNLLHDLWAEMNAHISETSGDRHPWVWILSTICSEIAGNKYHYPYKVEHDAEGRAYLAIMTSHCMHHIKTSPGLRAIWDQLPVKSDRVFKSQLREAGLIHLEDTSATIGNHRQTHMVGLNLEKMAEYGLHVAEKQEGYANAP